MKNSYNQLLRSKILSIRIKFYSFIKLFNAERILFQNIQFTYIQNKYICWCYFLGTKATVLLPFFECHCMPAAWPYSFKNKKQQKTITNIVHIECMQVRESATMRQTICVFESMKKRTYSHYYSERIFPTPFSSQFNLFLLPRFFPFVFTCWPRSKRTGSKEIAVATI